MLELNKRTHKVLTYVLVALVLLQVLFKPTEAATKCHKCTGINCQRTTYAATEDCTDALDSCVTVFQESMVLAQGCLGQLAVELRNKCEMPSTEQTDGAEMTDVDATVPAVNRNCHQCSEDLCNNLSAEGTDCLQCDSNEEAKCASDTESLQPQRCPISKAVNTYCYAKIEASRATRGCATDLAQQKECLSNNGCSLCSPSDINGCNRDPKVATNDTTSSTGGSSGGSDSGTSSGTGNGGSSSGAGNGGSDSGAGSGSGTGGGGSSSGSSGTSNGGSSSGGSSSGTSGGDSNSGSSGTGGSGSSSGGSSGGSHSGTSSGTGDGGSSSGSGSSGSGSDAGTDGSDSSSGSGSGSGSDSENSGASGVSNKLFVALIFMALPKFI
ncbi:GPI-anchored hemophore cfmA-like [Bactrocera tryoni]|uniref:GPI-anchored hemophore cfmA-like n=1 Tax=Bactrocera tryoni TaxID=59916 RepID=UPI001A95A356|nr:GPI-anchored hemophore cfmA-like [Bactrocera tryoni]